MRRFKELFCRSPPPPPQIKLVDFGVEVEVQIKNKKINWTPRGKAPLLSSQGDKKPTKKAIPIYNFTLNQTFIHAINKGHTPFV